ncbi:DUF2461 domain-containing protein [Nocardioides sp. Soil805]|uniref:DUF2461 domain-containing protein n=1 Tax=Nocardioides sp. Soil805 TaxID=1736416 RepID=UPI000702E206|nr:DUF2461 domain-containing protein [Nocardioides sp. Soil805]KRF34846.1 hypothetical protein ASG94_11825 [Nocardioides sp. Soil805]
MSFTGFPVAALDFYDDLEVDNTKSFWEAHRAVWTESVKAPMTALVSDLEAEFGAAKVFRPYRDVRFAKDKTPYKTHQGAFVSVAPHTGWYVQVSAAGVRTSAGFYNAEGAQLAAFRTAVAEERRGTELERILEAIAAEGYEITGEQLKTAPRGYDRKHPRIDLLRRKQLFAGRDLGFEPVVHTPELLDLVRDDWRATRPLVEWLSRI